MDFEKLIGTLMESPEMFGELLSPIVEKYKQPVYVVCGEILKIMEDYSNADAYFNVVAKTKKKQFDAYVAAGFSEDQAMSFMIYSNEKTAKQLEAISANIKLTK